MTLFGIDNNANTSKFRVKSIKKTKKKSDWFLKRTV